jgi:hypothetical protein
MIYLLYTDRQDMVSSSQPVLGVNIRNVQWRYVACVAKSVALDGL